MVINQFLRLFLTIIVIFIISGCVSSLSELAQKQNWPEVQRLIAKGADVNATDKYGVTTLMWASKSGNIEIVQALIDKGADINAKRKNNWGTTALMWASLSGHKEVVQLLLAKGADVNATDNNGQTSLMYASEAGKMETAQALIDKGANVNAEGFGPGALRINGQGQVEGVIKGKRETALSLAIEKQHKDIVNILRAHGAKE